MRNFPLRQLLLPVSELPALRAAPCLCSESPRRGSRGEPVPGSTMTPRAQLRVSAVLLPLVVGILAAPAASASPIPETPCVCGLATGREPLGDVAAEATGQTTTTTETPDWLLAEEEEGMWPAPTIYAAPPRCRHDQVQRGGRCVDVYNL